MGGGVGIGMEGVFYVLERKRGKAKLIVSGDACGMVGSGLMS